jgi:hypothetical protein
LSGTELRSLDHTGCKQLGEQCWSQFGLAEAANVTGVELVNSHTAATIPEHARVCTAQR